VVANATALLANIMIQIPLVAPLAALYKRTAHLAAV